MTQEEKVALLKKAGVWDVIGFPSCIDTLFDLVAAHEREKQAEQEPVEKEIAAAVLDHCYGYSAVNDDMIERTSVVVKKILDKHAAPQPVRTKDLTDGAIWEILETHPADIITAIRAVIAADREKNRG